MTTVTVSGLTHKQVELLDAMWAIEDMDDLRDFIQSLPKNEALECESLLELVRLAMIDAKLGEEEDLSAALNVISAAEARVREAEGLTRSARDTDE